MILGLNMTLKLVYREKLAGFGKHYGAILPDGSYLDFSLEGIRRCTQPEFAAGRQVFSEKEVKYSSHVQRRFEALVNGQLKYNLINFNCEHFARFLTEGESKSEQVNSSFLGLGLCFVIACMIE